MSPDDEDAETGKIIDAIHAKAPDDGSFAIAYALLQLTITVKFLATVLHDAVEPDRQS